MTQSSSPLVEAQELLNETTRRDTTQRSTGGFGG